MIAQCRALVIRTEQPALLQDRHDELDKVFEALVEVRRHHVEAVGGMLLEPELERVGDALGRATQHPMAAGGGEAGCSRGAQEPMIPPKTR